MATITINIPCQASRRSKKVVTEQASGAVAFFNIGDQRVKFILQHDLSGKPAALVHFASGMVFGRLNGPKLAHAVSRGTYTSLSDRGAAETLIARAVANLGAVGVLEKLASVPVLNS